MNGLESALDSAWTCRKARARTARCAHIGSCPLLATTHRNGELHHKKNHRMMTSSSSTGPFRRIGAIHRTSWPLNWLKVWEMPPLIDCGLVIEPNRWFSCTLVVEEGFGGSRDLALTVRVR